MCSSKTMAMLAEEYQTGILIASGVVWVLYIVATVFSTIIRYKRVGKLSVVGTIPIVHLALFFMDSPKRKAKKIAKQKAEEEKEVFDDVF